MMTNTTDTIKENNSTEIKQSQGEAHSGEFIDHAGERFYVIHDVDRMPPFFISLISSSDHWMFLSSTGGISAGRTSPDSAIFPYIPVDKIYESMPHTGSKTVLRIRVGNVWSVWEPFAADHHGRYRIQQNLYKNVLGNKVMFEQINKNLDLVFRYTWMVSDDFGFVRECELINNSDMDIKVDILDGVQNVMPANVTRDLQSGYSNLVDAYKWNELDQPTGLGLFTLYSCITDKALPAESLKANTVFCTGLDDCKTLISSDQLPAFYEGESVREEVHRRGARGSYLVNSKFDLAADDRQVWRIVCDVNRSQADVVELRSKLSDLETLDRLITSSVKDNSRQLELIMASADAFQHSAIEADDVHHFANVVFNVLRGGIVVDQYRIPTTDFSRSIKHFNSALYDRHAGMLCSLPRVIDREELMHSIVDSGDPQLLRLALEYLPITFGRRHGDPSRPWNRFEIRLLDDMGNPLLSYQGNWRDIFQNWESLSLSYPCYIESFIAKFVNASTADGYNPYRITKEGIDWEIEDPDDEWSFIGYWGDHQIIYLLKFLELSVAYNDGTLNEMLYRPLFSYANVPYKIKPIEDILRDPKDTIVYDAGLNRNIERLEQEIGADARMLLDADGEVVLVSLLEKLLVPLLAKLSNLVAGGGIWLNTQRPEWNDANNAIVGQGLSMVTACYMRRYIVFMRDLLKGDDNSFAMTSEVADWHDEVAATLSTLRQVIDSGSVDDDARYLSTLALGSAASRYREKIYEQEGFSGQREQSVNRIDDMLADAQIAIDYTITNNLRDDGLYHAYNLLQLDDEQASVKQLYPMLEGQVAALSSGKLEPAQVVSVLDALFASRMYREDQHTFMLYPDRDLPGFLSKNRVSDELVESVPLLRKMIEAGDTSVILRDADGQYRFNADLENVVELDLRLNRLSEDYAKDVERHRATICQIYESVFNHQSFTGRSGTMFGFEGLGCIYWHMVSKLLLAVQECFFSAIQKDADNGKRIGDYYYRVRQGLGYNKTPTEYGAFPTDPYSHTPKHAGAQQPGMTGQVKEELLARSGELGIHVEDGVLSFQPHLLRTIEFMTDPSQFHYLDVHGVWQELDLPGASLAFTICQVPVVYTLKPDAAGSVRLTHSDDEITSIKSTILDRELSREVFARSGTINRIDVQLGRKQLFE